MPSIIRGSTGGEEVIVQPDPPAAPSDGDLWVDTDEPVPGHDHDGIYVNETDHTKAAHLALGITNIEVQTEPPAGPGDGDLWVDSDEVAMDTSSPHSHDTTYVNEVDHTKAQHVSLGLIGTETDGRIRAKAFESNLALDAFLGSAPGSDYPLGFSAFSVTKASGWPADGIVETSMVLFSSGMIEDKRGTQIFTGHEGNIRMTRGWYPSAAAWSPWGGDTVAAAARRSEGLLMTTITDIVTWNGTRLKWPDRIIALGAGRGSHWAADGWFGFTVPASGTVIPGYNGAPSSTVDAAGIHVPVHTALYGVPTIGGTSGQTSLALVGYTDTAGFVIPPHWVLIASTSESGGTLRLGTGQIIDYWRPATLENGWVSYGTSWYGASYYKDIDGFVHLRGLIKSGTLGATALTLPVGYRTGLGSTNNIHSAGVANNAFAYAYIQGSGAVILHGSNVWWELGSITPFRAEA